MKKYGDKKWYGPIGRCFQSEAALDGKPEPGAFIGSFPAKNLHTLPDIPHHLKSSDYSPEMFLNRRHSILFITADSFQAMFSVCISGGESRFQNRVFCDSVMSFVAADKAAYPFRHKQLHLFLLQYTTMACLTKSAVPSPPALSILFLKRSSHTYISPSPLRISLVHT